MFNYRLIKYNDQGFTLIESLIAMFILGIVMAGSITFFSYANVLYYRGIHTQIATFVADSELEQIKSAAGCSKLAATIDPGSPVAVGNLTGSLKVTWPNSLTQDPCSNLAPTGTTCAAIAPTLVGACVTWTEPGSGANTSNVGLVTYVGA